MKAKDGCSFDNRGNLHWRLYNYEPNSKIAFVLLLTCLLLFYLLFYYDTSSTSFGKRTSLYDFSLSEAIMLSSLIAISLYCIYAIFEKHFLNYITGITFYQDHFKINYYKGNDTTIPYEKMGYIHFNLLAGSPLRRYSPLFSFYYKDPSAGCLDDVLGKKEFLIFEGAISTKRDYLQLKEFLATKGFHIPEQKGTLARFDQEEEKWWN